MPYLSLTLSLSFTIFEHLYQYNTDLGEVVVGCPAAAAEPPGDLAAEDEEGVHVSLPLDAHHAALPHRVASLPQDGRQLVRGLHQSEVSTGVT